MSHLNFVYSMNIFPFLKTNAIKTCIVICAYALDNANLLVSIK
jgi:hypothetical protein